MHTRDSTLAAPAALLIVLAACGGPAAAAPGDEVCALLKPSEVTAVFPGAKAGQPDASRRKYGITACIWRADHGTFITQTWKSEGGSARDEVSGLMAGVLDPVKPGARNNVRYETIRGIGNQAVAVVETKDLQRGLTDDMALLVVQKGDNILVLMAPELARRERAAALSALKSLAQSATARL